MIFMVLNIVFGGFVVFIVSRQRKKSAEFEKELTRSGWEKVTRHKGYDLIPQNEEQWKVEVRLGHSKSNASVTWSHPVSFQSPLIVLSNLEIDVSNDIPFKGLNTLLNISQSLGGGVLNDVFIKSLKVMHADVLEGLQPISICSDELTPKYSFYGLPGIKEHPFLTQKVEELLLSYRGANFVLILFYDTLEIRLRDRNVQSQFGDLIRLGQAIIADVDSR